MITYSDNEVKLFTDRFVSIINNGAFQRYNQVIMFNDEEGHAVAPIYVLILNNFVINHYEMFITRNVDCSNNLCLKNSQGPVLYKHDELKDLISHLMNFSEYYIYNTLSDKFTYKAARSNADYQTCETLFKVDYAIENGHRIKECCVCMLETTHKTYCIDIEGSGGQTQHSTALCWVCFMRLKRNEDDVRMCPMCRAPVCITNRCDIHEIFEIEIE